MEILVPLGIIAALILLNGLFVAAEFALVGAPRASLERRAAGGEKWAVMAFQAIQNPRRQDQFIATAQLGITFASLGLGMYGEHVLAEWIASGLKSLGAWRWLAAHATASVFSIVILTYFHIVLGEMVPKALALQRAEGTLISVTPVMEACRRIFYPLVLLLNGIGNTILLRFGIDRRKDTHQALHSADELQSIVLESWRSDDSAQETGHLVQEIFELDELTAAEVMVPRVKLKAVAVGTDAPGLAALATSGRHTRYPVYEESLDNIIGVLHAHDVLRLVRKGKPLSRDDVRPAPFVPESASTDRVLEAMRQARTQLCVVLDEFGGTAGIVTLSDIFEEVVGHIDEWGSASSPLRFDAGGRLVASGLLRLDEVGEVLHRSLEHQDVDTVGGLVLAILGRPPEVGDRVEYAELCFEVSEAEANAVSWCLITPCGPQAQETAVPPEAEALDSQN